MSPSVLFFFASILAAVSALSLFCKTEGLRGSGRVAGGVSTLLIGISLLVMINGTGELSGSYSLPAWVIFICGLVTIGSGARKFARRKIS